MAASETFLDVLQRKPVLGGARHGQLGGLSSLRVPLGPQLRSSESAASPWATTRSPLGKFTAEAFAAAAAPSEFIAARFVGLAPELGDASAFKASSASSDSPARPPSVQVKSSESVQRQPTTDQTITRPSALIENAPAKHASTELSAGTDDFLQRAPISDDSAGLSPNEGPAINPSINRSATTTPPIDSNDEPSTIESLEPQLPPLVQPRPFSRPTPLGDLSQPLGARLAENVIQQPESIVESGVPPVQARESAPSVGELAVAPATRSEKSVSQAPSSEASIARRPSRSGQVPAKFTVDSPQSGEVLEASELSNSSESSMVQARDQSGSEASATETSATAEVVSDEVASSEVIQPSRLQEAAHLPLPLSSDEGAPLAPSLVPSEVPSSEDTVQPSIASSLPVNPSLADNFSPESPVTDSSSPDNFSPDSSLSETRLNTPPSLQTPSLSDGQAQSQPSAESLMPTPEAISAETPPVQPRVSAETTHTDSPDLALRPTAGNAERVAPQLTDSHLARTEERSSESVSPETTSAFSTPPEIAPTPYSTDSPDVISPKLAFSPSTESNPAPSISPAAANLPAGQNTTVENSSDVGNISDTVPSTAAEASMPTSSNAAVFPSIQRRQEDISTRLTSPLGMRTPLVEEAATESISSTETNGEEINSKETVRARMDAPQVERTPLSKAIPALPDGPTVDDIFLTEGSASGPSISELTAKLMRKATRESADASRAGAPTAADEIALWQTQFEQDTVQKKSLPASPTIQPNSSLSTSPSSEATLGQTVDLFSSAAQEVPPAANQLIEPRGDFSIEEKGAHTADSDDMLDTLADVIYAQLREHLYRVQESQRGYAPPLPMWSPPWSPPATGASRLPLTKSKNLGNYHGPWPPKLHQLATDVRHQVESRLRQDVQSL